MWLYRVAQVIVPIAIFTGVFLLIKWMSGSIRRTEDARKLRESTYVTLDELERTLEKKEREAIE
jgi:hypothetical protein